MAAPRNDGFDPGASTHGNFINYYSFNPAENRTKNIPKSLIEDLKIPTKNIVTCLDVGCNSGELTTELYRHLTEGNEINIQFLGVDLDPTLIERCCESNKFPTNITFDRLNIMDDQRRDNCLRAFLNVHNCTKFHVTFAFSITMWIHINHGDDGLREFLHQVSKWSQFLLIEPQPWKCYRLASRRLKRSTPHIHQQFQTKLQRLQMRENIEQKITTHLIEKCDMKLIEEFDKTKWNRRMLLFKSRT